MVTGAVRSVIRTGAPHGSPPSLRTRNTARSASDNVLRMLQHDARALDDVIGTATLSALRGVTREDIARRAFENYCERSKGDGFDIDDWLRAERECAEACAPFVSVRLRIKADRRRSSGSPPAFDCRRKTS